MKKESDKGFVSLQTDTARKMVLIEVLRLGSNLSGSAYQRSVANAVTNHEQLNPPTARKKHNYMMLYFTMAIIKPFVTSLYLLQSC